MAAIRTLGNVEVDKTVFFLCDMQERFRPVINYFSDIVEVSKRLVIKSFGFVSAQLLTGSCNLIDRHIHSIMS